MSPEMHVRHISPSDIGGGAEKVASDLNMELRAQGIDSELLVGRQLGTSAQGVSQLSRSRAESARIRVMTQLMGTPTTITDAKKIEFLATPFRALRWRRADDDFSFDTRQALAPHITGPTILHYHNVHGRYLNLEDVAKLSLVHPTVLTAHDLWLMTGGCIHPLECRNYKNGCSDCPQYPTHTEAVHHNWARKETIYRTARFHIIVPSLWVKQQLMTSPILAPAIADITHIPNGVDVETFCPGDKRVARERWRIAPDARVIVFSVATQGRYKDSATTFEVVQRIQAQPDFADVTLVVLGNVSAELTARLHNVVAIPFQAHPADVASVLQTADVFLYATKAETFGLALGEAQACGLPVVATDVGPITELIAEGKTGYALAPHDIDGMVNRVCEILSDDELHGRLSINAQQHIRENFSLELMVSRHKTYYEQLLATGNNDA